MDLLQENSTGFSAFSIGTMNQQSANIGRKSKACLIESTKPRNIRTNQVQDRGLDLNRGTGCDDVSHYREDGRPCVCNFS